MFARTIVRSAVRQPCRRLAVTNRGIATSSNSSRSATSKTASIATSIVALAAGGVVIGSMLGDSKKMYLEGASKRPGYSERMISKEKGGESSKNGESKEATKQGKSVEEEKVEEAQTIDMEDLSEDASQQSAFDPETNTINWDCPCLGGMAQGPCGEEFKEAFSCFVFSEEEVKGVDCIDKFKAMQDCFRKYPEHYKEELEDEEEFEKSEQEREATQQDSQSSSDDDEGVREWRAEMEREGKK